MNKYITIGLIVIFGSCKEEVTPGDAEKLPAIFAFQDNLATVGDEIVPLEINIIEDVAKLELFYNDSLLETWNNPKETVRFKLKAGVFGVGTRTLNLLSTLKDGSSFVDNRMVRVLSDIIPEKKRQR